MSIFSILSINQYTKFKYFKTRAPESNAKILQRRKMCFFEDKITAPKNYERSSVIQFLKVSNSNILCFEVLSLVMVGQNLC